VIFLAGPHAGVLPQWAEAVVLGLGWLAVFVLPVLVARRLWRRLGTTAAAVQKSRDR
jgi:lauroyl/myristoyl acyltransferase